MSKLQDLVYKVLNVDTGEVFGEYDSLNTATQVAKAVRVALCWECNIWLIEEVKNN